MIRPRPTQHITADPFGLFVYHSPTTDLHTRTPAWCPHCGAKLSTYRPLGDVACWACQQGAPIDAETLHPKPEPRPPRQPRPLTSLAYRLADCPRCGGRMHKDSKQCRECQHKDYQANKGQRAAL